MKTKCLLFAGLMVVSLPAASQAVPITGFCDTDGPLTCEKSLDLVGNILTIILTNTSPPGNSGFITADAFDLPGNLAVIAFSSTNPSFGLAGLGTTGGSFNTAPDGTREFVISTSPGHPQPYEGGGSPTGGIGVGSSATFTLTLSGAIPAGAQEAIFLSELVRGRGFADGRSDKDHVTIRQVPEPSSLLLLGVGLIALSRMYRRHR